MPEIQDDGSEKFTRVGSVSKSHDAQGARLSGSCLIQMLTQFQRVRFKISSRIWKILSEGWGELSRTHWAVKDVDLFQVLFEHQARLSKGSSQAFRSSGAVRFPVETLRNPKLVAVMMPFKKEFDVVHETIRGAVDDAGLIQRTSRRYLGA